MALVKSELVKINDEIKLMEEIKTQEEHAQTYRGNHRSTLKQEELREWAKDTKFLNDKTDSVLHIQNKLPRLHDQVLPSSLQEFAFLCTRAANFSSLYEIRIKKNPLRSKVSNLLQRVLLRG